MAPSVDDFQVQIGRDPGPGDVLHVNNNTGDIRTPIPIDYEIIQSHTPGIRKILFGILGQKESDCVEVVKLTRYGTLNKRYLFSRSANLWDDIIRVENRIDKPAGVERR